MKIVESGTLSNPGVIIIKEDEDNKKFIRIESSLMRENCCFKLTKKQCERLGKFLIMFSKGK